MKEVVLVVRERSDAVLAVVELLHAYAALVVAGAVHLGNEFPMNQSIDQPLGKLVVSGLDYLVER